MYGHHIHARCSYRSEEGMGSSGTGYGGCEPPWMLDLLKEQQMLWTTSRLLSHLQIILISLVNKIFSLDEFFVYAYIFHDSFRFNWAYPELTSVIEMCCCEVEHLRKLGTKWLIRSCDWCLFYNFVVFIALWCSPLLLRFSLTRCISSVSCNLCFTKSWFEKVMRGWYIFFSSLSPSPHSCVYFCLYFLTFVRFIYLRSLYAGFELSIILP